MLPPDYRGESRFRLRGRDFHYLVRVLRLGVGDSFDGLDRAGRRVAIEIREVGSDFCGVEIEPRAAEAETGPRLTLFQCLLKGAKMDLVVRQAAEAGVLRIVPVVSGRSVPRLDETDRTARAERWSRIAREALQQSGRPDVPAVAPPLPFAEIPGQLPGGATGLFFHQAPLANKTLHEYLSHKTEEIALVVGPEGGLSAHEAGLLESAGFGAVYLGRRVLRAETAALYAVAAVQTVLLEKDTWIVRPRSSE